MNEFTNAALGVENAAFVVVEFFIVAFLALYVIFAGVVIKQVNLMIKTLEVGLDTPIKYFAYAHLFASVILLLFSIFLLLI